MDDLISRQAAVDALKNDMASLDHIIKGISAYDVRLDAYVSQRNQVSCDIYTIKHLPPAQPEPCEDAVSREEVLNCLEWQYPDKLPRTKIMELPPVMSKQRTGKWIPADSQCGIRCSVCGVPVDDFCYSIDYIELDYKPNFCPNCGLKMEE